MSALLKLTEGWTPVIDLMAKEHGLVTAAVFGRIWRFCQMEDRVCRASQDTIGECIGVSAKTVQRHAQKLCQLGYLKDLTPTLQGAPHIYRDTGKLQALQVELGQSDRSSVRTESPNSSDLESDEIGQKVLTDRSESPIKKEEDRIKKEEKEGVAGATPANPSTLPPHQANFQALCDLCIKPVDLLTADERGEFNQVERHIRTKGHATYPLIQAFGAWWYQHDWRGKQGQPPEPSQVRKEWGRFMHWHKNGRQQSAMTDEERERRRQVLAAHAKRRAEEAAHAAS